MTSRMWLKFVVSLTIASWAALDGQVQVSPKLQERAVHEDRVPVLMVLREQPQAEILTGVREEARPAVQKAAKRYQQLEALRASENDVRAAESELYDAIVAARRSAAQRIGAATATAQDALATRLLDLGGTRIRRYLALNMMAAEVPAWALDTLKAQAELRELLPDPQDPAQLPDVFTEIDRTLFDTAGAVLAAAGPGWADSDGVSHLLDQIRELYHVKISPVGGSVPLREADLEAAAGSGEWRAAVSAPLLAAAPGPIADARGMSVVGGKPIVWTASKVYLVDTVTPLVVTEILSSNGSPIAGTQGIANAGIPIIWTTGNVYAVRTFVPLDVVEIRTPAGAPIAGAKGVAIAGQRPVIWTATNVYFADTITPLVVREILSPSGSALSGVQGIVSVNGIIPIIRTATNVFAVRTFIPMDVVEIRTPSGGPMSGARGITMVASGSNPIIWTSGAVYFVRTLTPLWVEEIRTSGGASISGASGVADAVTPMIWTPSNVYAVRTLAPLDVIEVRTPAGASMAGVQKVVVGGVPFMWTATKVYAVQSVTPLNVIEIRTPGGSSIAGTKGLFNIAQGPVIWTALNIYLVDTLVPLAVTELRKPDGTSIRNVQGVVAVSGVIPIIWTPTNVYMLRRQNDMVEIRTPSGGPIAGTRGVALSAIPFIWTATNVYAVRGFNPVDVVEIVAIGNGGACSYTISPASATVPAAGSTGTVTVTALAGCAWTAASNSAWITVVQGSSGNGPGSAVYSVVANTGTVRTGSLTIAGQTFAVTQQAPAVAPLAAQVQASTPPVVGHTAAANIADFTITFSGGTTAQQTTLLLYVFLSVPLGAVPDTAILTMPGGATISGVRASANAYVFPNVPLVQPGPGATSVYRITNMKANTLSVPAGSTVLGIALPISTTQIRTASPVWSMALVQ